MRDAMFNIDNFIGILAIACHNGLIFWSFFLGYLENYPHHCCANISVVENKKTKNLLIVVEYINVPVFYNSLLSKNGDKLLYDSYRSIALLNVTYKTLATVLKHRLTIQINEIEGEYLCGSHKGRGMHLKIKEKQFAILL